MAGEQRSRTVQSSVIIPIILPSMEQNMFSIIRKLEHQKDVSIRLLSEPPQINLGHGRMDEADGVLETSRSLDCRC